MILSEFVLLASDTARSKAYLNAMISEDKLPGLCIVYTDDIVKMEQESICYLESNKDVDFFDINIPILTLLRRKNIEYCVVNNRDINSEEMGNVISELKQKYLIYSGYGGYILKKHLFQLGKKFIHIHAGVLPQYRGSTTAYYSYLQSNVLGASSIFLSEGIDEGNIIIKETFQVPKKKVDIDYIYEPYIRAQVLIRTIDLYLETGELLSHKQENVDAETYHIIHPVLKHVALLKMENKWKGKEK